MSTDVSKYVHLKRVVAFALDEEDKSQGDFDKGWLFAFRAMIVMGFAAEWEPKTVRLPVNGNGTVTIPADCITWTKIGILNASNEVVTLKINNALTTLKDNNPNRTSYLVPDVQDTNLANIVLNPNYLNYYFGNWYTPLFGLGNGMVNYGECTVDEKNNVIVMGPQYPFPDIIFEYISSPQNDQDYMVETCLQEAYIAFIRWKFKKGTEGEFYARFREGRRSLPNKRFTLQEANQAIRENLGYKVKA